MRSHFPWKKTIKAKSYPQPLPLLLENQLLVVQCGKESRLQEIKLNYHPDRFMWCFTFSLCCFRLRVEVHLSWERTVKYAVK